MKIPFEVVGGIIMLDVCWGIPPTRCHKPRIYRH